MRTYWSLGALTNGLLTSFIYTSDAADFEPTSIISNSTLTSNFVGASTPSVCCFVFQDTITEVYALIYSTSFYYQVVNLTSYTVRVTPGLESPETNIETNIYPTNASFTENVQRGFNPLSLYYNYAPGPTETSFSYNSSQIVTHGVTVQSPQAIYIYSSVTIITASPVTDAAGNLVCSTTLQEGTMPAITFNSNAQATYYGASDLVTFSTAVNTKISTSITWTDTVTFTRDGRASTDTQTGTYADGTMTTLYFDSNNKTINIPSSRASGVVVSFPTPFVYQPESGATGKTDEPYGNCNAGPGSEGIGYPPQTLLDYMVKNSAISKQYPGLESCLPGGPFTLHSSRCSAWAPVFRTAGGDLTESTVIMITQPAYSSPIAAPTTPAAVTTSAAPGPTIALPSPETNTPAPIPSTVFTNTPQSTSTSPEFTRSVTTISSNFESSATPILVSNGNTNTEPQPPFNIPGQTVENPKSPPTGNSDTQPPANNAAQPESQPQKPADKPASDQSPAPSAENDAIADAIADGIGATHIPAPTVISGTTAVVVSGETTVAVDPALPIAGSTTIIDGVTNVVISSATTVPVSEVLQSLPGTTTLIDGNLQVVIPPTTIRVNPKIPELSGSPTIVSGVSYVVITGSTTVPVVLGQPTSPTNSSLEAPLQFTAGAGALRLNHFQWIVIVGIYLFVQ